MSKRPAAAAPGPSDPSGSDPEPGTKKQRIVFEPLQLGPIANLEELEVKTLAFQNQKLGLRLTQRIHMEEDLRTRIDQLEKRQTQDDALINIIHRYWNQLNEDIRCACTQGRTLDSDKIVVYDVKGSLDVINVTSVLAFHFGAHFSLWCFAPELPEIWETFALFYIFNQLDVARIIETEGGTSLFKRFCLPFQNLAAAFRRGDVRRRGDVQRAARDHLVPHAALHVAEAGAGRETSVQGAGLAEGGCQNHTGSDWRSARVLPMWFHRGTIWSSCSSLVLLTSCFTYILGFRSFKSASRTVVKVNQRR
jgi:hypothetical protein